MRTLGLIGGLSWESTTEYYRLINQGVRARMGPTASAPLVLWSFDFAPIAAMQHAGDWDGQAALMADAARRLQTAGAHALVICSNTMHSVAPAVEAAVALPLVHIADATADRIAAAGHARVALLGTRFTMERDFLKGRLAARHGLDVIVPDADDRTLVNRVIYDELIAGIIREESRAAYRAVIARLVAAGAQAIILGCTEIMLLVRPEDSPVPLFDTTAIHAEAAVEVCLSV